MLFKPEHFVVKEGYIVVELTNELEVPCPKNFDYNERLRNPLQVTCKSEGSFFKIEIRNAFEQDYEYDSSYPPLKLIMTDVKMP